MKDRKLGYFYRLTALLLAALMLFVLPSCNGADGGESEPTTGTTSTTTTEPTTGTTSNNPATPEPPLDVEMHPAQEVRVLSQNVLAASTLEDIAARAPTMIEYFMSSNADSIGVQECVTNWTNLLDEGLQEKYARVGVAVDGNDKGWFATYVYYLKDKYRVIDTDTFWLSETPDVPSQYGDTVDMNRTCTWVILEDLETGFRYVHMNCHLDWMDTSVNSVQIRMIREMMNRFASLGYPVFATGDFNTKEGSTSYIQMLASKQIKDSKKVAKTVDYTSTHGTSTIDYCFVTGANMVVEEYDVIPNVHGEIEVSDHSGVFVHATVNALPKQEHSAFVPQMPADATVSTELTGHTDQYLKISVPQAVDSLGFVAKQYELVFKNEAGEILLQTNLFGGTHRLKPAEAISASVGGGVAGQTCRLEITPISVLGDRGETFVKAVVWPEAGAAQVQKPENPDILDVSVQSGAVVDRSPNQFQMTQVDSVTVTDDAMVFDKKGNIRTPDFTDQYPKMVDGFTLEIVIKTGSDVKSTQKFVSNMETGGYGFTCKSSKLRFSVYNGSGYVYAETSIEANTTYHVIAIYDGMDIHLYLDGELKSSTPLNGTITFPKNKKARYLCIGGDSDSTGKGDTLSSVTVYRTAIYSKVLTRGEVAYIFQNNEG